MRTYDLVMLALLGIWWLFYRKKYDRNAVVLHYIGGVFLADVFCALLILLIYKRNPAIVAVMKFASVPANMGKVLNYTGILTYVSDCFSAVGNEGRRLARASAAGVRSGTGPLIRSRKACEYPTAPTVRIRP